MQFPRSSHLIHTARPLAWHPFRDSGTRVTAALDSTTGPSLRLIRAFRALGDPTRLALLRLLALGEHAVGDLVRKVGAPQPAVSRHLRVLREAGLVRDERRARRIVYRLAPEVGEEIRAALPELLPLEAPVARKAAVARPHPTEIEVPSREGSARAAPADEVPARAAPENDGSARAAPDDEAAARPASDDFLFVD